MVKKLPKNYTISVYGCVDTINDLIDLVNSQQEAIGELQTEIGVLRNMVLQSQEAIEKLESKVWTAGFIEKYRPALENLAEAADDKPTAKEIARAILDEPLDDKPENKNYKLVTESEPFDRVEYEKAKFVRDREKVRFAGLDTHRTVTLRIPKGMSIVEAIEEAYQDTIIHTDTDLQKALDEVQPNE
jgi:ABC-type Fe3+/spermidine/putrescine transport system ATPase subunit